MSPFEEYRLMLKAIQSRRLNELQEMVAAGFNVNYLPTSHGFTLLKTAVYLRHEAAPYVGLLLQAKANPDLGVGGENNHLSPLSIAIDHWNIEVVRMLLEAGASQLRELSFGTTALHSAVNTSVGICQLLIEHGGDVNAKNQSGETPLDYLIQLDNGYPDRWPTDIAKLLIDHDATYMPSSLFTKSDEEANYIRSLLEHFRMANNARAIPLQQSRRAVTL